MKVKKFQPLFPSASFYQKIEQSMKIQERAMKSRFFLASWIFLEFLESSCFVRFSGKSLPVLAA